MTTDIESLKAIIQEQQRDYDYLLRIYERAGAKQNVLLTATFGVIAYLYYADGTDPIKETIKQRLFIPDQDYGIVIYIIASAFFAFGLFKLMLFNVFGGNDWETAYESSKLDYSRSTAKNLQYIKGRYDASHQTNVASYIQRKKDLTLCFYFILVSAIILIVIKTLK